MFFIFSKLFDFLIQPMVWIILILVWGGLSKAFRKKAILSAIVICFFFGNRFIFENINQWYEHEAVAIEQLQNRYSAAIILGGMASLEAENEQVDFSGSSDRLFGVLPLYFNGKVEKLLLSGGSGRLIQAELESDILSTYLLRIGVDKADIIVENKSRNTYENALYSHEVIDSLNIQGPFLLSTSASHMYRSLKCFKKVGLAVDPYPVDFFSNARTTDLETLLLPQAEVLNNWKWLLHEWLGLAFYKIKGYI